MRYEQLEHAIRAACDVAEDTELIVFGSQAILGNFPDAPESLRSSIEVDVQPKNKPDMTDLIDGVLGQESRFHQTHGFYVHGILIDAATLPEDWERRTIPVSHFHRTRGYTGHCIEVHDLAASKLVAFRPKDREFVTVLLSERLIDQAILIERISKLPLPHNDRDRLTKWVETTIKEV